MITRRDLMIGAAAASVAFPTQAATPKGIVSIIDTYWKEDIEPEAAAKSGVIAYIHKATEGSGFQDKKYKLRREAAKEAGLLWGSFHFSNNDAVEKQVENYLKQAEIKDDDLICLDFEHNKGKEMSLSQAHEFVQSINKKVGRYPMLYGGAWLREQVKNNPDPILKLCPLWYRRYAAEPKELPTQIWPKFTLWQYTDGQVAYGGLPLKVNGIQCDRNLFEGTEEELKKAWPFTKAS